MIIIVGCGPSGFMAAYRAAKLGKEVLVLEKKNDIARKILITGKGRCNLTNIKSIDIIQDAFLENKKFLYSAFKEFNNIDLINFFEKNSVPLKEERGGRIFPKSDEGKDIIDLMKKCLRDVNVKVVTNCEVSDIILKDNRIIGVKSNQGEYYGKVIIATGGKSYPLTGSAGDGQRILSKYNINIKRMTPSLVPLLVSDNEIKDVKMLQGLSLKNANLDVFINNKKHDSFFGEMLFTHEGISGPIVLSASRDVVVALDEKKTIEVYIDLKPKVERKVLDNRIIKVLGENRKQKFKRILKEFLPSKMIEYFLFKLDIDGDKLACDISKNERKIFLNLLKGLKFSIVSYRGYNKAIVTRGGISLNEVKSSDMSIKKYEDLYAIGEVLDLDAFTGGYNLQGAFSMGYLCGSKI